MNNYYILILFMFSVLNSEAKLQSNSIIDMHCHVACIDYKKNGCFVSSKMKNSYKYKFYLKAMGVKHKNKKLNWKDDKKMADQLHQQINDSKYLKQAVILALDAPIKDGKIDFAHTEVYVPNDYIYKLTQKYPTMLFGASINPNRPDALELLEQVKAQGAKLIKWIPSIMNIDPSNPKHTAFYKKMIELKLPLLTHTSDEKTFTQSKDRLADPMRLELPLSLGVTVVAAHAATQGWNKKQSNFIRFLKLYRKYPDNLYADISSLTQINKFGHLKKVLKVKSLRKHLLYGSDWPLQFSPLVSPLYYASSIGPRRAYTLNNLDNDWDKDIRLKRLLGTPEEIFNRVEVFLNNPYK